jgi:hypothetical protein
VHDACAFPQFYGNANENTKRLFRDRLKARATPTLAMFNADGEMRHSHSGANKSRLEFYLREFIGETSSETIYPPYQLTGVWSNCGKKQITFILPQTRHLQVR